MAGRHAAPLQERTTHSTETSGPEVVPAAPPATLVARTAPAQAVVTPDSLHVVPEAFTSRRARREAERAGASAVAAPDAAVPAPPVLHFAAADRSPAQTPTQAARTARASRRVRRAAVEQAVGRPTTATPPRAQHHPISLRRAALLLAPVLAVTSGIALASPADAAPLPQHFAAVAQRTGQVYTVASDVRLPVVQENGTTVVSLPTLVVSGGATVDQAQTTLRAALAAGGDRATILETALAYLGDTYVEGGASHQGIDCSGLTMVAYQSVGIQLAHYVPTQDAVATTIPEAEALPGDLVVYDNEDHVGLYLGDGLVLQAPHPGEPVDIIPMFSAAHHFARVLPA